MTFLNKLANVKQGFQPSKLFAGLNNTFVNRTQLSIFQARFALEKRVNELKAAPAVDFSDSKIRRLQAESDKLERAKNAIADTKIFLTETNKTVDAIEAILTSMKTLLQSIQPTSTPAERAAAATLFDEKLKGINDKADGTQLAGKSLLGKVDRITFRGPPVFGNLGGAGVITLQRKYLGSDFHIRDDNGTLWLVDGTGGTLREYTSYPSAPTGTAHALSDLVLDSFDTATGQVSISGAGSISGNVVRGGLDVLNSFLYSGFADTAAVDRATQDVDAALAELRLAEKPLESQQDLFDARSKGLNALQQTIGDRIQNRIDVLLDERGARIFAEEARMHATLSGLTILSDAGLLLVESLFIPAKRTPRILDFTR